MTTNLGFNPIFQPSGMRGIGATSVPLSSDPYSSFITKAQLLQNGQTSAPPLVMPNATAQQMAAPTGYFDGAVPDPHRRATAQSIRDKFGAGAVTNLMSEGGTPNAIPLSHWNGLNNGGVRVGAHPDLNAVQSARQAQGLPINGGRPPAMPPPGAATRGQ